MLLEYLSYPSREEWRSIADGVCLNDLYIKITLPDSEDFFDFFDNKESSDWLGLFNNRLGEVRQTYIFLTHYFNMGIPDDIWYKSPGDNGQSIQYYPNFDEKHHYIKHMYDYYADIFYFKLSSAWETMFHFINVYFRFRIPAKVRFKNKVLERLELTNHALFESITAVHDSAAYKTFTQIRNNITHNFSPNEIDPGISRDNRGATLYAIGKYTPTNEIQENIIQMISIVSKFLKKLKSIIESGAGKP